MGCRRVASPEELVRVAVGADGALEAGSNVPGRGAWLCRGSVSCLDQATRRHAFGRALRAPVPVEMVERLRTSLVGDGAGREAAPQVCEDGMSGPLRGARPDEEEGS
ncbi:MAG: YlxR family protein [Acidimicrobiales bacterium]